MDELLNLLHPDTKARTGSDDILTPPFLSTGFERPDKREAIEQHTSRFTQ